MILGGLILFIDTETTGFPHKDWRYCPHHIVEFGWILTDSNCVVLEEYYSCVQPRGYNIEKYKRSFAKHKIKQSEARRGQSIKVILNKFLDVVEKCSIIVGHNVSFDLRMIQNELNKNGITAIIEREIRDTYKMSRLSLSNLYEKLFGETFDGHRVKEDIVATKKCYEKLINTFITT